MKKLNQRITENDLSVKEFYIYKVYYLYIYISVN